MRESTVLTKTSSSATSTVGNNLHLRIASGTAVLIAGKISLVSLTQLIQRATDTLTRAHVSFSEISAISADSNEGLNLPRTCCIKKY
jgi:hypothetical protein